mgnify:CR=1 FL=1
MANVLIINEKPSVSREFAHALGVKEKERHDGYIEGYSEFFGCTIWITWCIGHLVAMSYPEKYDEKYKNWKLEDLPFLPSEYKYEVIDNVKKQYDIVHKLLHIVGTSEEDKKELSMLSPEKKNFGSYRHGLLGRRCRKRRTDDRGKYPEVRRRARGHEGAPRLDRFADRGGDSARHP